MRALILAAALAWAALPAQAHRLKVFVAAEGAEITGTAYFAGGGPAQDAAGRVTDAQGREIAAFRTDAQGNFRVAGGHAGAVTISIDSGDGHAAQARLGQEETAAAAPPSADTDTARLEEAIARQLTPLKRQLDQMESRARFSDVVGGIGFIFGIFGVAAWWSSRRKQPRP